LVDIILVIIPWESGEQEKINNWKGYFEEKKHNNCNQKPKTLMGWTCYTKPESSHNNDQGRETICKRLMGRCENTECRTGLEYKRG